MTRKRPIVSRTCAESMHGRCVVSGCACGCHTPDPQPSLRLPPVVPGVTIRLPILRLTGPVQLTGQRDRVIKRGVRRVLRKIPKWRGCDWFAWVTPEGGLEWHLRRDDRPGVPAYVRRVQLPVKSYHDHLLDTVRREAEDG